MDEHEINFSRYSIHKKSSNYWHWIGQQYFLVDWQIPFFFLTPSIHTGKVIMNWGEGPFIQGYSPIVDWLEKDFLKPLAETFSRNHDKMIA